MKHKIEKKNDLSILKLSWELSQKHHVDIDKALHNAYNEWSDLILDMWEVTYVNSTVIWSFMTFYNKITRNMDKIVIWESSPEVEEAFDLIWISRLIRIIWNNEKAKVFIEELHLKAFKNK